MSRFLPDSFVAAVAAAFLVFSLLWGLLLPTFESVDEQNHYRYMVFLKDHGRLPRQLPAPAECPGQGHQPPLYYALGAGALEVLAPQASFTEPPRRTTILDQQPVYFVHGPDEGLFRFQGQALPPHLLRFAQVLFLLLPGLFLLAWILGQLLPSTEARLALALLTLNPAFLALCGALNNDNLAWVLGTLALATLLPAWHGQPLSTKHWVAFGLVGGWASLAKSTAMGLLLLGPLVVVTRPQEFKKPGMWLGGLAWLGVAGWWFWRNQVLYGDLTALTAVLTDYPHSAHPQAWQHLSWWSFWARVNFESYWSVFGWMTWRSSPWVTWTFLAVCLASGGGLLLKSPPGTSRQRLLAFGALAGVTLVAFAHDRLLDPPAGRHFYAALLPLSLLMGQGLGAWKPPAWTAWVTALFLVLLNTWLLFGRLVPLYYPQTAAP